MPQHNLSVQFGKRILFDEVNTTPLHTVIFTELLVLMVLESNLLSKIIAEMDPTSGISI
jgi:hypothetical protein